MNSAIAASGSPDLLEGAVEFLKYGPLGLAGLMLVLLIVALQIKKIEEGRERLLRQFLYVGAFCFVVASVFAFLPQYSGASHVIHLRVDPIDMGEKRKLPAPIVTMNGAKLKEPFDYPVVSEVTAIIDVSDAINFVEAYRAHDASQRQVLNDIATRANDSIAKLVALNNLETGNICFGGAHGVPSPDAPKMAQLSSAVRSEIASTLAAAQSVVQQSPPDVTEFKRAETSR
jgi:hypothetical protein